MMRIRVFVAIGALAGMLGTGVIARAGDQLSEADALSDARAFYDDARYAQALHVLDQLAAATPTTATAEVHAYRALCLIALGRTDAAERAMADIVAADPFFRPDPDTSPRVVSMFAATRRRLLPPAIRRGFAEATALYREGARLRASERFDEVLRLIDDPALGDDQSLADLALVASAFVELTRAQTAAPVTQAQQAVPADRDVVAAPATTPVALVALPEQGPGPAPGSPAQAPAVLEAPTSAAASATGQFRPPVALDQPLPEWTPPDTRSAERVFEGAITLAIDERGRVIAATKKRTIHPAYDRKVLEAAREWSFTPALRNGQPVKSELTVEVRLKPPVE
jgi:TonB family protein